MEVELCLCTFPAPLFNRQPPRLQPCPLHEPPTPVFQHGLTKPCECGHQRFEHTSDQGFCLNLYVKKRRRICDCKEFTPRERATG